MRPLLVLLSLLLALPVSASDAETARTLTNLLAIVLDQDARLTVMSSADVREVVALEGDKAAMGCDVDASSCLAEVAGAMGARYVVFSQLGRLGSQLLLTLNLFDSEAGQSSSRQVVRAADAGGLGDKLDAAVAKLLQGLTPRAGEEKAKMLVLDVRPPEGGGDPEPPAPEAPAAATNNSGGSLLGIGVAGLGLASLAGGGVTMIFAIGAEGDADRETIQLERKQRYEEADALWLTTTALAGAGAIIVVAGLVMTFSGGE